MEFLKAPLPMFEKVLSWAHLVVLVLILALFWFVETEESELIAIILTIASSILLTVGTIVLWTKLLRDNALSGIDRIRKINFYGSSFIALALSPWPLLYGLPIPYFAVVDEFITMGTWQSELLLALASLPLVLFFSKIMARIIPGFFCFSLRYWKLLFMYVFAHYVIACILTFGFEYFGIISMDI